MQPTAAFPVHVPSSPWSKVGSRRMWRIGLIVAGIALASRGVSLADGPTLVALTADGILLRFSADRPADVTMAKVTGASGQLVGLDRRPANGVLYGLTAVGDVYRVDPV